MQKPTISLLKRSSGLLTTRVLRMAGTNIGKPPKGPKDYTQIKDFEDFTKQEKYISKPLKAEMEQQALAKHRVKDYKDTFLGFREEVIEEEQVRDEVFGFEFPNNLPQSKISPKELYARERHRHEDHFRYQESALVSEILAQEKIFDDELEAIVEQAKLDFEELRGVTKDYDPFFMDLSFKEGRYFIENESLKNAVLRIADQIKNGHAQSIPGLLAALTMRLKYNEDVLEIMPEIEKQIMFTIHLFDLTQLSKILVALNFYFPKTGSLKLREVIRDLLMAEFVKTNSFREKAIIMTALRGFSNTKTHLTFLRDVMASKDRLHLQSVTPGEVLAYIKAFSLVRLPRSKRKISVRVEPQPKNETLNYFLEYYDHLIDNWDILTNQARFVMATWCLHSEMDSLHDFYDLFEQHMLENLEAMSVSEVAHYSQMMAFFDQGKAVGSDAFWGQVVAKMTSSKVNQVLFCDKVSMYASLANAGIDTASFLKWAKPSLISHLEGKKARASEVGLLIKGYVTSESSDKQLAMALFKAVSFLPQNYPLEHYYFLKLFRYNLGVDYPNWEFSYFDGRCFPAEMTFNCLSNVTEERRNAIAEVYSMLAAGSDLELYSLIEWENIDLVDIAFAAHRVGIVLDIDTDLDLDRKASTSKTASFVRTLEKNGWTILAINLKVFRESGVSYIEEIRQQLSEAFTKAVENQGTQDEILRKRNLMRVERFVEDIMPEAFDDSRAETFVKF